MSGTVSNQTGHNPYNLYPYFTPPDGEKRAGDDKNPKKRRGKKGRELSPERIKEFAAAKMIFDELQWSELSPDEAVTYYRELCPTVDAYPLRDSRDDRDYRAWCKFNRDSKPGARFFGCVNHAHLYSLHAEHLGLPDELAKPEHFFDHKAIEIWREQIKSVLAPPLWYKIALGDNRIHCHVIASVDAGLLNLPRDGEIVKPVDDPQGALSYLFKPVATCTPENLALWIAAKRTHLGAGNLPRYRGTFGVPNSRTWNR